MMVIATRHNKYLYLTRRQIRFKNL